MFKALKRWTDTFTQDTRFAVRALRKSPAFTMAAVTTLGLGIGANSAVFTVVDAVLLKGLPYRDADRLVHVWETQPAQPHRQLSYPDFRDIVDSTRTLDGVAGYRMGGFVLSGSDGSERVPGGRVSYNFFSVLGVEPILGRSFKADEDQPGRKPDTAVISFGFWQRRFAGDPGVIGKRVVLDGDPFTVIGVLPREFHFARLGSADVFATLSPDPHQAERRYMHWMSAIGRLRDGVSVTDALNEMSSLSAVRALTDAQTHKDTGISVDPLRIALVGTIRPLTLGLFAAVAAVLLIACANVANMLLARALSRRREIGIRLAMGAGRGRIIGQFLTESLILSMLGGALGLLWAGWGVRAMVAAIPEEQMQSLPFLIGLRVDPAVLAFTLALCVATGLVFGLIPALRASSDRVTESLKDGARGSAGKQRLRSVLVVSEIAIALSLVAATGLLTRSLSRLLDVDPGFDTKNLLTARITLPGDRYDAPEKVIAFFEEWRTRIAALPGVSGVALVDRLPLLGSGNTGSPAIPGIGFTADSSSPDAELRTVNEDYFRVMGLSLESGRSFGASDKAGAPRVVVVNEAFVADVLKGAPAEGQMVTFGFVKDPLQIVGVVSDEKAGALDARTRPVLYFPWRQDTSTSMNVVIRSALTATATATTTSTPARLITALRSDLRSAEPGAVLSYVRTMDELIAGIPATFLRRYPTMILSCFALLGIVLASVGIYGVMSLAVAERTSEIGIRMALGSSAAGVLKLILKQGATLAALGVTAGVALGLGAGRVLSSVLFETPPSDPSVLAASAAILLFMALAACLIPALRAARVDPIKAVRQE